MFAAAFAAISCEHPVETIWSDGNEALLVVNAQLLQDKHTNRIIVNCSEGAGCSVVRDAEVECSINGGAKIAALPVVREIKLFDGSVSEEFLGYDMESALSAGDEISIEVNWDGLSATARTTVPESAASITALDTMRVVLTRDDFDTGSSTRTTRQYNITIKDKPGEKNYYLLMSEEIYYRLDASGRKVASFVNSGTFDASDDVILHSVGSSILDVILGRDDNIYELFDDGMFADASHTLKIYDLYYGIYLDGFVRFFEQFEEGESYSMDRVFKIYTISFEEYLYLKAVDAARTYIDFMTEPVVYPGNVTGGLGFITAATPATCTVSFPTEPYSGEPPYNACRYR